MKYLSLLIIFSLNSFSQQAAEQEANFLESVMDIRGVPEAYEECQGQKKTGSALSDCIWSALAPDAQEEVTKRLGKEEGATDYDNKGKYESLYTGSKRQVTKSKGQENLEKYMYDKLSAVLFEEIKDENSIIKNKIADQEVFYNLFETQVGKNIVAAYSSYCLEADTRGELLVYKDDALRAKVKEQNHNTIQDFSTVQHTNPNCQGANCTQTVFKGKENFNNCIISVSAQCHNDHDSLLDIYLIKQGKSSDERKAILSDKNLKAPYITSLEDESLKTYLEKSGKNARTINAILNNSTDRDNHLNDLDIDKNYTKMRACEVVNYVKSGKQNLLAIQKVKKQMDEIRVSSGQIKGSMPEQFEMKGEGKTIEDLTTLTSGEFVNKSNFHKGNKEDVEFLEECKQNGTNDEKCKDILDQNFVDEEFFVEESLKNKALANKLEQDLKDPKNLESYLKEQGFSDEKIESIMSSDDNVKNKMIAELTNKYKSEKEQLIASMAAKLKAPTQAAGQLTQANSNVNEFTEIQSELASKTKDYAQLLHYSNIVTGYLEIRNADGRGPANSKSNTVSITKELQNSAFTKEGIETATQNNIDIGLDVESARTQDEIVSDIEEGGIELSEGDDTNSKPLQVENVNDILYGDTFKEFKKQ